MKCPNCNHQIPKSDIKTAYAKIFASKGGSTSKRTISKKQRLKMQLAKEAKNNG